MAFDPFLRNTNLNTEMHMFHNIAQWYETIQIVHFWLTSPAVWIAFEVYAFFFERTDVEKRCSSL